ncbi:PREDICTED: uncharacterized protein LOC106323634 [Brassica oleracea var. oleracea]|uniref:uncharacterized protein LOC106323634 n=1 Tax=Brassica oleracea var. oleracea TaxID=109376 RepID=UPI0006A6EA3F|nr:PREDICTED: uncharacterized protein LOC106323634 [Brassica oleracea var. oleracea]
MANEKFGPHLPMIIEARDIETLYELWGIDYAVEIEAPEDCETPETVRPGHYGAYTSHFQDRGLSFPLPRFLLEALAELGMAFAQMAPNFWRYFLASWIRAREEGLRFGLEELKQRFSIRRNSGFPGTMILAPRPGRSIIDGIPNRDDRWREKFFVFKINQALVGDFDIETIHREWSSEIEPFGSAPMTPELRGLIATLRRGSPQWLAFTVDRIRAAYTLPPGEKRATPVGSVVPIRPGKGRRDKSKLTFFGLKRFECLWVAQFSKYALFRGREKEVLSDRPDESSEAGSIAVPVCGAQREPNTSTGSVGDRALDDEIDSPTHQSQRRALKEINSVSSNSPSSEPPPPLRASGEGTSQVDPSACFPDVQETSSWRFSYDDEVPILENPEGVASI